MLATEAQFPSLPEVFASRISCSSLLSHPPSLLLFFPLKAKTRCFQAICALLLTPAPIPVITTCSSSKAAAGRCCNPCLHHEQAQAITTGSFSSITSHQKCATTQECLSSVSRTTDEDDESCNKSIVVFEKSPSRDHRTGASSREG